MDLKKWIKKTDNLENINSEFIGWDYEENKEAKVVALFNEKGQQVQSIRDKQFIIVLDKTPFYAEKGGQTADGGQIITSDGRHLEILDVQQGENKTNYQLVENVDQAEIKVNEIVDAQVDRVKRLNASRNHTGAHLTYAAILNVLGDDVLEDGNANDENGLYIDFHYTDPISEQQKQAINDYVQNGIKSNTERETHFVSYKDAVEKLNALAVFTGRYDENVRVIKFGDLTCELCGGTHVSNTGVLEDYLITELKRKDNQRYRIRALTSKQTVEDYINKSFNDAKEFINNSLEKYETKKQYLKDDNVIKLADEINSLKVDRNNLDLLDEKLKDFKETFKEWDKEATKIEQNSKIEKYLDVQPVKNDENVNVIDLNVEGIDGKDMAKLGERLSKLNPESIIIIKASDDNGNYVLVMVDSSLNDKYSAIDIFRGLDINPKGGGNKNRAQGKF